jgi:hypothetical protein
MVENWEYMRDNINCTNKPGRNNKRYKKSWKYLVDNKVSITDSALWSKSQCYSKRASWRSGF